MLLLPYVTYKKENLFNESVAINVCYKNILCETLYKKFYNVMSPSFLYVSAFELLLLPYIL